MNILSKIYWKSNFGKQAIALGHAEAIEINEDIDKTNKACEIITNALMKIAREEQSLSHEIVDEKNNKCSNCGASGEAVIDRFQDIKGSGSINGSIHGYGSSFLGCGSSSIHGHIKGSSEMHTETVRTCTNCQNQWKAEKKNYRSTTEMMCEELRQVTRWIANGKCDLPYIYAERLDIWKAVKPKYYYALVNKYKDSYSAFGIADLDGKPRVTPEQIKKSGLLKEETDVEA
jgi:hypothetical protein